MRREHIHYIGRYMVVGNGTRRYAVEKIALPGIFVISLLAAWLVIMSRSGIRLTAPIELSRSGLSVSMPSGNGWWCEGKWMYDGDSFAVSSIFSVRPNALRWLDRARRRLHWGRDWLGGTGLSYARCRYLLASRDAAVQERFAAQASGLDGEVVETGQTSVGQIVVDWARIKGDAGGAAFETILGVCGLPAGRGLEIEVLQTADEQGLAQNIFERIVKSIRLGDNGLLQAGAQLVSEAKSAGLGSSTSLTAGGTGIDGQPIFFVLSDARGQAIGFTMDAMVVQAEKEPAIKAASYYYLRGPVPDEEVGLFRGDSAFERFGWRVEGSSGTGVKGVEITGRDGAMTVRKSTSMISVESGEDANGSEYVLGEAAVPDIVLEPVLRRMLDGDRQEIIIDVIRSDGTIVPAYIEKTGRVPRPFDSTQGGIGSGQADNNSIRMEVLDGRGHWQQIYYDNDKQPTKILLGQDGTYTLMRADANEIAEKFPERADLVFNQGRLLDREEL